jgi:hypothetical protein
MLAAGFRFPACGGSVSGRGLAGVRRAARRLGGGLPAVGVGVRAGSLGGRGLVAGAAGAAAGV